MLPNPTVEIAKIEVFEQYSDPKDSKNLVYTEQSTETPQSVRVAVYAKTNRNYCKPYKDISASGSSFEDEEIIDRLSGARKRTNIVYYTSSVHRNSSIQETSTRSNAEPSTEVGECTSAVDGDSDAQKKTELRADLSVSENLSVRHRSPYYYGDLFKPSVNNFESTSLRRQQQKQQRQLKQCDLSQSGKYQKSGSLDIPGECNSRNLGQLASKRNSLTETCSSEHATNGEILSRCVITEWDYTLMPSHRLTLGHDLSVTACTCLASAEEYEIEPPPPPAPRAPSPGLSPSPISSPQSTSRRHKVRKLRRSRRIEPRILIEDYHGDVEPEVEGDKKNEKESEEMTRQRQVYETAFDCKVSRSDDDLDDVDRMTNHPLLISQLQNYSTIPLSRTSSSTESSKQSQQMLQIHRQSHGQQRKVVLRPKVLLVNNRQQQKVQRQRLQINDALQGPNITDLSHDIESFQINSNERKDEKKEFRVSPPSPPSTAPLPSKFHGAYKQCEYELFNIRSTPNLFSQQQEVQKLKQRQRREDVTEDFSHQNRIDCIHKIRDRPKSFVLESKDLILEFKGRPEAETTMRTIVDQQPWPHSLSGKNKPIMEFKRRHHVAETQTKVEGVKACHEDQANLLEFKMQTNRRRIGYSSTESMTTSSNGGSMESLRSSTSEGNRSTSSSESRHSTSLSSHSSDSGSTAGLQPQHRINYSNSHGQQQQHLSDYLAHYDTKLHILSPISDKSSLEPTSETSDNNRNNNSQTASPVELYSPTSNVVEMSNSIKPVNSVNLANSSKPKSPTDMSVKKRRVPQNKNLINLALQSSSSGDAEVQGSDSGISIESRAGIKCNKPFVFYPNKVPIQIQQTESQPKMDNINNIFENEQECSDLPFDMPKLRRRRLLMQQHATTSGSTTSVDLKDLPFDMPKLKRRLRCTPSIESSISQDSSSLSIRDLEPPAFFGVGLMRPNMTLNLDCRNEIGNGIINTTGELGLQLTTKKPSALNLGLSLELTACCNSADLVDIELPLERQGWYHGSITRIEAEAILRLLKEGSYLVRNSESTKQDYSLSLKSARGFMHMRIQKNEELNAYILGQFSNPFDTIPEMVRHFSINRLPIRGAEHMCLLHPVIAQLL